MLIRPTTYVISLTWLLVWPATLPAQGPPPALVKVAPVTMQPMTESVTLVGTVEPRRRSLVASEVGGLVERHPVDEGDGVKQGELLVKLKTDTLELDLKVADAAMAEAKALHEQAVTQLVRTETLYNEGLATLKQFQDDQADAQAKGERVIQLESQIAQVRDKITKSRITAPFDGLVVKKFTEVGQWLKQGDAVIEMVDLDHMRVEIPVPEQYIGGLSIGDKLGVAIDALPGGGVRGKILSIVSQADASARTFPVKIDLENPGRRIRSGMTARVDIAVGPPMEKKTVPKDALVIQGGNYLVYVVMAGEQGSTVAPVPVRTGIMTGSRVEIDGAVQVGQQVVIRGNERLRPGQPVQVME